MKSVKSVLLKEDECGTVFRKFVTLTGSAIYIDCPQHIDELANRLTKVKKCLSSSNKRALDKNIAHINMLSTIATSAANIFGKTPTTSEHRATWADYVEALDRCLNTAYESKIDVDRLSMFICLIIYHKVNDTTTHRRVNPCAFELFSYAAGIDDFKPLTRTKISAFMRSAETDSFNKHYIERSSKAASGIRRKLSTKLLYSELADLILNSLYVKQHPRQKIIETSTGALQLDNIIFPHNAMSARGVYMYTLLFEAINAICFKPIGGTNGGARSVGQPRVEAS